MSTLAKVTTMIPLSPAGGVSRRISHLVLGSEGPCVTRDGKIPMVGSNEGRVIPVFEDSSVCNLCNTGIKYADLKTYRDEWLRQAEEFRGVEFQEVKKLDFFFQTRTLNAIDIQGARAVAHKKFDGRATTTTGETTHPLWQTLYLVKKSEGSWKTTGFVGYLPNPLS